MYSTLSQANQSIGRINVSSQVACTHRPSRYFMCSSLISWKRLTGKVRMWPNFWPMNRQSLFLISPREQAREQPFSKSFSCSLPKKWLVQAIPGYFVWQTTFSNLKTILPKSSSSPLTSTAMDSLLQCFLMATLMLGTAVMRCAFRIKAQRCFGSLDFWRKMEIRSAVPSFEASSTMTILQLLQSWLMMDCILYSQRQFLALLWVVTTTQMGSSYLQRVKWYFSSRRSIYFCTSSSICLRYKVSMNDVRRLRRLSAQGFLIFSSWNSSFLPMCSNIAIFFLRTSYLECASSKPTTASCSPTASYRASTA